MKSERRHELEHNVLANWMGSSISTVKPYANAIMGVVLALLIMVVAAVLWAQKNQRETARSWEDFYSAMSSGSFTELENVVDQYPGSDAAHWAAVISGDLHLTQGCQGLFSDRAKANQELTKAVESYQDVLGHSKNPAIRERATFGAGAAREGGELQKAEKDYRQLVDGWPDGPYAKIAQVRIDDLKRPDVKAFYDRFAKFEPKPAFSDEPGTPGLRPEFETDTLPTADQPLFPTLDSMKLEQAAPAKAKPADVKPTEAKPAAPPAPDAAKPDQAKPVEAKQPDATPKPDVPNEEKK